MVLNIGRSGIRRGSTKCCGRRYTSSTKSIARTYFQVVIAQAEYADNEALVPQVTSLVTFMQIVGAAIGLSYDFYFYSPSSKANDRS
jgi:hypothetical protein